MNRYSGKFSNQSDKTKKGLPFAVVFVSFLLIEAFGLCFLMPEGETKLYPSLFGLC